MCLQECKYIYAFINLHTTASIMPFIQHYSHAPIFTIHYQARKYKRNGDFASAKKRFKISLHLNIAAIFMMLVTWGVVGAILGIGRGTLYLPNPLQSTQTITSPPPNTSPITRITTSGPPATSSTTKVTTQTTTTSQTTTCWNLSNPGTLVRNNTIGRILGTTGNYRLSFDIVPADIVGDWSSILHFTGTDTNLYRRDFGSRAPGIFFWPSTTGLHVRIGDSTDHNWGIDAYAWNALPFYTSTKVMLECIGVNVTLTVGETVYTAIQPTHRFAGNLTVYAGDPWYLPAKAAIYNVEYTCM